MKRGFWKLRVVVLVFSVAVLVFPAGIGDAQVSNPTIFIREDGSIEPSDVPIQRNGDVYTFTGDVYAQGILVERKGVTIDGAGHILMGPYTGNQTLWTIGAGPNQTPTNETFSIGIDVLTRSVSDLTVKNLNIKNFSIGMYLWTANSVAVGNSVTNGIIGILIQSNNINVTKNYIANFEYGVYFGETSTGNISANVKLVENCFADNLKQLDGCVCKDYNLTEDKHTWDDGFRGNYWSDYTGVDNNNDGIGDTPYEIDPLNWDRFPLMQSPAVPPTPSPTVPFLGLNEWHIISAASVVGMVVAVVLVWRIKHRKTETRVFTASS